MKAERDAYGQEIWNCYQSNSIYEVVERDDGFIDIGSALSYFQEHPNWPLPEREAIRHARGKVLDIGCGAGRVGLYLQKAGLPVLGIDNSPLAVKVARLRGLKNARVLPIRDIHRLRGRFDTIILYGNNFGLLGGMAQARRLLKAMHAISSPSATVLAASADPYKTRDPLHLAYHKQNRERGRMGGQIRFRIRYRQFRGDWFDYLFVSIPEMRDIIAGTGWTVSEIVKSPGPGYVAMLRKSQ